MTDTPTARPDPEDRLINHALGELGRSTLRPEDRTTKEAVLAYLHGTADARQREDVQRALGASRQFREEIAGLSQVFDEIEQAGAGERFAAAEAGARSSPEPPKNRIGRPARKHSVWISLALAAAVIAILLLTQVGRWRKVPAGPRVTEWNLIEESLVPRTFEPLVLRSGEATSAPHPEAIGAAIESFRRRVEWRDGRLLLLAGPGPGPDAAAPVPKASDRLVLISVLDREGSPSQTVRSTVPADNQELRAWFMTYPGLDLFSVELPADTLSVPRRHIPSEGLLVVTYRGAGGYQATEPFLLSDQ